MRNYKLTTPIDANGQPVRLFRATRENYEAKELDQLSGICEGILADGVVNEPEANFFAGWVRKLAALAPIWPFTEIFLRGEAVFAEGSYPNEERQELNEIMEALCGQKHADVPEVTYASSLPFNVPPPDRIQFADQVSNITGKFAFGARRKVTDAIACKGGVAMDSTPMHKANYLIMGILASRDGIHMNCGRKIERAIGLRNSGSGIAIISEEHWNQFVP